MIKLSFIIPAYNASGTIIRCLDSIYALPIQNQEFEVIVIDDCSTDNTLAFLQEYATTKSNMLVLHQKRNQRQGAARNRGVQNAKGEYIAFVDADDEVAPNIVDAANVANNTNVDMLFCNTLCQQEDGQFITRTYDIPIATPIDSENFAELYYDTYWVGPWTYLWKRSFLVTSNIPFIEGRRMEDFDFVEKHVISAKNIAYYDKPIYKYYTMALSNSTVHTVAPDTIGDWVHVSYRRMKWCDSIKNEFPQFVSRIESQSYIFVNSSLSLRRLSRFSPKNVQQIFDRIGAEAFDYFKTKSNWRAITYLCIFYPFIAKSIVAIATPIAILARKVVQTIRKIKH